MIRAVIFDMDGVIVDSEEAHMLAFRKVFAAQGIEFSREDMRRYFGIGPYNVVAKVLKANRKLTGRDIDAMVADKDRSYRQLFEKKVKPVSGIMEFLRGLKGMRLCIASSTSKENIAYALKKFRMDGLFEFYVAREDVERTKPDPDIYLEAVRRLGLPAGGCIVIEDTPIGIRAAKKAGLRVIGITTTYGKARLKAANYIIESYGGLTRDILQEM